MSNTQQGLITVLSTTDFSSYIGRFAKIGTDGYPALPSAGGIAFYVIEDAYTEGGYITPPSGIAAGVAYKVVLRPLSPDRNIRVKTSAIIVQGSPVTSDAVGLACPASSGNYVLAYTEAESAVSGQYALLRPMGGLQTQ